MHSLYLFSIMREVVSNTYLSLLIQDSVVSSCLVKFTLSSFSLF